MNGPGRRFVSIAAGAAAAIALCAPVQAENSAPAIVAFEQAFTRTNDYTCHVHAHEIKGSASQNRVYDFSFMRPHYIKTLIIDGDGKGSGGVWTGGDQISGHQGGILSGIHLKVDLHDSRAVSLRGFTMPEGLLQNIVHNYVKTPGTLTQTAGGKISGILTDRLDLKVANPSTNDGISEQIMYLSQETHWPIRQVLYSGNQIVSDQTITDLKTNVGLTQGDFPF